MCNSWTKMKSGVVWEYLAVVEVPWGAVGVGPEQSREQAEGWRRRRCFCLQGALWFGRKTASAPFQAISANHCGTKEEVYWGRCPGVIFTSDANWWDRMGCSTRVLPESLHRKLLASRWQWSCLPMCWESEVCVGVRCIYEWVYVRDRRETKTQGQGEGEYHHIIHERKHESLFLFVSLSKDSNEPDPEGLQVWTVLLLSPALWTCLKLPLVRSSLVF